MVVRSAGRREPLQLLELCAGYGGIGLGADLAAGSGARAVCYVEREAAAAACLVRQMGAGGLAPAPVWSDVCTFDGAPWRGRVDIVSAGFPCQPFSAAGLRRGVDDERWIWPDIARVIREVEPAAVILENVPGLLTGPAVDVATVEIVEVPGGRVRQRSVRSERLPAAAGRVLGALAALGFDAEWTVLRADDAGAPHERARVFVLAWQVSDAGRNVLREFAEWHEFGSAVGGDAGARGLGEGLAFAEGDRRGPGTGRLPAPGRADADDGGREVGNAARADEQRIRGGASCGPGAVGGPGSAVGNANGRRLAGLGEGDDDNGRDARGLLAHGYGARPFWPPGPDDEDGWREWIGRGGPQPGVRRGADGAADRVDRLRLLGGGVVPLQVALALGACARRGLGWD